MTNGIMRAAGGDLLDDVDPITVDGRRASTLVLVGTSPFEKCDLNSIPDAFGPGDTETTCQVAMLSGDQEDHRCAVRPRRGGVRGRWQGRLDAVTA